MKNVTNNTKKLYKRRPFIVITFIILIALCVFVSLRGEYLQVLEIGEKYTEVFMHNLEYKALVMVLNFLIIFISVSFDCFSSSMCTKKLVDYYIVIPFLTCQFTDPARTAEIHHSLYPVILSRLFPFAVAG